MISLKPFNATVDLSDGHRLLPESQQMSDLHVCRCRCRGSPQFI